MSGQNLSAIAPIYPNVQSFNSSQQTRHEKLLNSFASEVIGFITINNLQSSIVNNKINISLPWLSCQNLIFKEKKSEYIDDNNYYWYGSLDNNEEEEIPCSDGSITLMARNGEKFGHLMIDGVSYEIFELGDGIQILTRFKLEICSENECETPSNINPPPPPPPMDTTIFPLEELYKQKQKTVTPNSNRVIPCEPNCEVRILVLWTPAAEQAETNIQNRIALGIVQTNLALENSEVSNNGERRVVLAGSQQIPFNETGVAINDVETIATNPFIQGLRAAAQADLVIVLVEDNRYGATTGRVRAVGPSFNDAFGIVRTTFATGGRYTFVHEVGHFFGGLHDFPRTTGFNYGMSFNTGFIFTKLRWTLMAQLPDGKSRELNFSNPNVPIKGKATGIADIRDNARQLRETFCQLGNFFQNPIPNFNISIINDNAQACLVGYAEASVQCGNPPFTYLWESNYNGFFGWETVGTSETLGFYNVECHDYALLFLKLTVTDALGRVRTVIKEYGISSHWRQNNKNQESFGKESILKDLNNPSVKSKVVPNPSVSSSKLILGSQFANITSIKLMTSNGLLLKTIYNGFILNRNQVFEISTSDLVNGIYFIQILSNDKKTEVLKLIVNH